MTKKQSDPGAFLKTICDRPTLGLACLAYGKASLLTWGVVKKNAALTARPSEGNGQLMFKRPKLLDDF